MRVYLKMMLLNLESQMQYKVSFLMTVFGQFITAFAGLLSIKFMFEHVNMIYGFNDTDVILCYSIVVLSFSIGEAFGGGLATFGGILGDGSFDRALVRPRNVVFQILAPHVDFTRIGLLIQAVGTLAYAISKSEIRWDCKKIITLMLMIVCGSVLFFSLFLFKATFTFFTVLKLFKSVYIWSEGIRKISVFHLWKGCFINSYIHHTAGFVPILSFVVSNWQKIRSVLYWVPVAITCFFDSVLLVFQIRS